MIVTTQANKVAHHGAAHAVRKMAFAVAALLILNVWGGAIFLVLGGNVSTIGQEIYRAFITSIFIGYGDIVPNTDDERTFTAVYILISFCVVGYALSTIADVLLRVAEFQQTRQMKKFAKTGKLRHRSAVMKCWNSYDKIVFALLFESILILVGAAIIMKAEEDNTAQNWTYGNGVWFWFVTLAGIGYGDFFPITHGGRTMVCIWLILGVGVLSVLITSIAEIAVRSARHRASKGSKDNAKELKSSIDDVIDPVLEEMHDVGKDNIVDFLCEHRKRLEKKKMKPASPPGWCSAHAKHMSIVWAIVTFLAFGATICISGAVINAIEGWGDYGKAVYFSTVTLTTLGYGEIVVVQDGSKAWIFFYFIFSIGILLRCADLTANFMLYLMHLTIKGLTSCCRSKEEKEAKKAAKQAAPAPAGKGAAVAAAPGAQETASFASPYDEGSYYYGTGDEDETEEPTYDEEEELSYDVFLSEQQESATASAASAGSAQAPTAAAKTSATPATPGTPATTAATTGATSGAKAGAAKRRGGDTVSGFSDYNDEEGSTDEGTYDDYGTDYGYSYDGARPKGAAKAKKRHFRGAHPHDALNIGLRPGIPTGKAKEPQKELTTSEKIRKGEKLFIALFALLVLILGGGAIMMAAEKDNTSKDWSYRNALYFMMVSLSTVGYGDFFPITPGGRAALCIFVFLGLGIFGVIIKELVGLFASKPEASYEGISTLIKLDELMTNELDVVIDTPEEKEDMMKYLEKKALDVYETMTVEPEHQKHLIPLLEKRILEGPQDDPDSDEDDEDSSTFSDFMSL